jgi:aminoglycoside 3-N-acetyltransferase I
MTWKPILRTFQVRIILRRPLVDDSFIAPGALKSGAVVGGIPAYDLEKLEQERSETCICVVSEHRREVFATALLYRLSALTNSGSRWISGPKRISFASR